MIYLNISVIGGMKLIKKDILKIKNIYLIEFILIFILLLIFSIITIKSLYKNNNYILINGKLEKEIHSTNINLNPGSFSENNYELSFLKKGIYFIELNITKENIDIFEKYLTLKVIFNEETVYISNLEEIIKENKSISFKYNIKNKKPLNLKICYEMALNAENETQGKSIYIDLNLYIRKVG